MNVGFVSLGCSKNLVDTEMTIGLFKNNNYKIVSNPEEADIIVINTCGFIEPAKQEAINTILEMAEYKKKKCKYLIVMGCLVQRYKEDLEKLIPEVDLFIKYQEYNTIWQQIESVIDANKQTQRNNCSLEFSKRVITTGKNFAYLRIADGVKFIEENFDKKITAKDAAEMCFLSESHFRMLFAKCFKVPPAKYINDLKIKKATSLLKSGLYSIVEVSKMVGIDSPSYFSWFYKKHTSLNPSDVMGRGDTSVN